MASWSEGKTGAPPAILRWIDQNNEDSGSQGVLTAYPVLLAPTLSQVGFEQ